MNKTVKSDSKKNPIKPVVPKTESTDGAYIDTLKQLREERETAD